MCLSQASQFNFLIAPVNLRRRLYLRRWVECPPVPTDFWFLVFHLTVDSLNQFPNADYHDEESYSHPNHCGSIFEEFS